MTVCAEAKAKKDAKYGSVDEVLKFFEDVTDLRVSINGNGNVEDETIYKCVFKPQWDTKTCNSITAAI